MINDPNIDTGKIEMAEKPFLDKLNIKFIKKLGDEIK